jgi:hypothetical protein
MFTSHKASVFKPLHNLVRRPPSVFRATLSSNPGLTRIQHAHRRLATHQRTAIVIMCTNWTGISVPERLPRSWTVSAWHTWLLGPFTLLALVDGLAVRGHLLSHCVLRRVVLLLALPCQR